MHKKILIVGNLGYVGPVLGQHLRRQYPDAQLIGFDTGYFQGCLLNPQLPAERYLDMQHFGDVRCFPQEVLQGVDGVVALAAISNDPMGLEFENCTQNINANAIVDLAKLAKVAGVAHFVFASSCSVYGAGGEDAKSEDDALMPLTAYAQSKIACEMGLEAIADARFCVSALRFATACGYSPRLRLDLVLNDFLASAMLYGRIDILSDGTPLRPLIDVEDMARAIEWGLQREPQNGGAFVCVNTGANDWNFQVQELAQHVAQMVPNTVVHINQNAAPDRRSYRVDFSKFAKLAPQFVPQKTLKISLTQLHNALAQCGFSHHNFRESHLVRLMCLRSLRADGLLNEDLMWM